MAAALLILGFELGLEVADDGARQQITASALVPAHGLGSWA